MTFISRGETFTTDQEGCARCGADRHTDLLYTAFTRPIDLGDLGTATHYAVCPENGEPILLVVKVNVGTIGPTEAEAP